MPKAARVSDQSQGTPHCHSTHPWSPVPHPVMGPISKGSGDCNIEGQKAARLTDTGIHQSVCCGPNTYRIMKGSSTVYINDKPAARVGDTTLHCDMVNGAIIKGAGKTTIGG